jgi:hypothetical protein
MRQGQYPKVRQLARNAPNSGSEVSPSDWDNFSSSATVVRLPYAGD